MNNKKIVRSYKQEIMADKETLFPLLCPVKEMDWLPGWEYEMVFSESGVAEKGCVFETNNVFGKYHWVTSIHDLADGRIQYVKVGSIEDTILDIFIEDKDKDSSYCTIQYTIIPRKAEYYEELNAKNSEEGFAERMKKWEHVINYYIINGELIKL